ncbi:hypothetical protein DFH27DRAFT_606180 [Peziza echinospora]|nr:hypothetical protein DFH27DRAFT_606180 [Peziza echinospora]
MDHSPPPRRKAVVIGGGPVGCLAALYLSKSDWDVELYELRPDPRAPGNSAFDSKSINLALAERGYNSIKVIDEELLNEIIKETVPMVGRCIHPGKGNFKGKGGGESQKYDVHGRHNWATDRARLNIMLLDWIEKKANVKLFFGHGLKGLDLDKKEANFEDRNTKELKTIHADFFIGSDGAHSTTRRFLQRYILMDYEQIYIDTLWKELEIPPDENGDFKIDGNHLHIWPRKDFMFIAIPSTDKSFTCTLFMPQRYFDQLGTSPSSILAFFTTHFPDVITLIGKDKLIADYTTNSAPSPLISIKCSPYHYLDRCVIIGDAAHAMVPFYGQGMNAGFEDVRVLFEFINDKFPGDLAAALEGYSRQRKEDAHTINDLAMRNYVEMRDSVTSRTYKLRKGVEETLYDYFPRLGVRTLYSMVSFSNLRYSEVVERVRWQNGVLNRVGLALAFGVGYALVKAVSVFRRARGRAAEQAAEGAARGVFGAVGLGVRKWWSLLW